MCELIDAPMLTHCNSQLFFVVTFRLFIVQDDGFHSLDPGFCSLNSGFQIGRGFRNPENWPRIKIPDSSHDWILDYTIWIPDFKAIKSRNLDSWIILHCEIYYRGGTNGKCFSNRASGRYSHWKVSHFPRIAEMFSFSTTPFRIKLRHNFSNINISASIYPPFK
jgi:hypothetical protein